MSQRKIPRAKVVPFVWFVVAGMAIAPAAAQSAQRPEKHSAVRPLAATDTHKVSPYSKSGPPNSANNYYQAVWGVSNFLVRLTASGNLVRFSYRVNDAVRAKMLADDHTTPYLYGQRSHAVLHVPVMENVGQLRQSGTLEVGEEYWMVFSNKGNLVKTGDRVNVIIGDFHADGLVVE